MATAFAIAVPATLPQTEMNLPKFLFFLVCLAAMFHLARPFVRVAAPST